MAEHKVPQDVEAEDKLLGPFSLRQFLYLLIVAAGVAVAYFLGRLAVPLAIIPVPVILVFGILSVPRKGQPMETYVGALIHFYFQPTKRLWEPDGQDSLVEITAPTTDDAPIGKGIDGAEAAQRLSFLADVADTQGWSTRGVVSGPVNNTNLVDDLAAETADAPDILDTDDATGQAFDDRLASTERQRRAEVMAQFNTTQSPTSTLPQTPFTPNIPPATTVNPAVLPSDEMALANSLKQASQQNQITYQQTVIQPPSVIVTPTATVSPITAATTTSTTDNSSAQPGNTPPTHPASNAVTTQTDDSPSDDDTNNLAASATIESVSDKPQIVSSDDSVAYASNIDTHEPMVLHTHSDNGKAEVEISLH